MQHVFLIGAKSLGAYGGYETFIDKLTEYHQNLPDIQYHVACKGNGQGSREPNTLDNVQIISDSEFIYHNAHCFLVKIPEKLGPAQAIYYDVKALNIACEIIEKESIHNPIIYILACRIGPFMNYYYKKIHQMGGRIFLNPDGHEWMRAKWNKPIRMYWKKSEELMIKHSDLVICDSIHIEKYIHDTYFRYKPKTTYIAYGAETDKSNCPVEKYEKWCKEKGIENFQYYLIVGRFVPENNYETMIREFMKSKTNKSFVILTNVDDSFLKKLEEKLQYTHDSRIKFVGTVYDQELLKKIREEAFAYLHGHEVGGTNPSLLEALGSTQLNLLLKVGFNQEVALDSALYWTKDYGNLCALINQVELMSQEDIEILSIKAKQRIKNAYSWGHIAEKYKKVFLEEIDYGIRTGVNYHN